MFLFCALISRAGGAHYLAPGYDVDSLIRAKQSALFAKPTDTHLLQLLGDFFFGRKQYDSALVYYQLLAAQQSQNAHVQLNQARCHIALQEWAASDSLLQKCLALDSNNYAALQLQLPVFLRLKKWDDCSAAIAKIEELDSMNIVAALYSGLLHREQQQWLQAMACYNRCLQWMPGFATALELRAEAQVHLQNYQAALTDYTAAGLKNIHSPASFNNIGICYYALHDYPKAIRFFHQALDSNWQQTETYFNRGAAFYQSCWYDSASQNWLAAAMLWDSCRTDTCRHFYKDALYCLGHCYKKMGNAKRALSYFAWLQDHGYDKDLSNEITNLSWSVFIAEKWYWLALCALLMIAAVSSFWWWWRS